MEAEQDHELKKKQDKTEKFKNILIVILIILLCIFFDYRSSESENKVAHGPVFESAAVEWTGEKKIDRNETSDDRLRIPEFKSMTVEADTHLVDVNLHNPASNQAYMLVRLVLSDRDEILYESKLIEPGKGLYKIHLSSPLEEGSHKAQIHYEPYDMDKLTRLNGAVINFELIARVYDE